MYIISSGTFLGFVFVPLLSVYVYINDLNNDQKTVLNESESIVDIPLFLLAN